MYGAGFVRTVVNFEKQFSALSPALQAAVFSALVMILFASRGYKLDQEIINVKASNARIAVDYYEVILV